MTLEEVRAEALKLSPEDQARLVDELVAELHGQLDPRIAEEWYEEADRRMQAFDRGDVQSVPAAEVIRDLRAKPG